MLYRDMSIYCNSLGAIYRYGKIQYRHSSSTNTKLNSVFPAWSLNSELSSCGILCENVIFSIIFTAAFSLQAVNDDLTRTLTKIIWNEVVVPSVSPWHLVVEVQVFVVCFWNKLLIEYSGHLGECYVLPSWQIAVLEQLVLGFNTICGVDRRMVCLVTIGSCPQLHI